MKDAAGDRYADIELTMLIYMAVLTDDRAGTMAASAPLFGLEPAGLEHYPHAWAGTVDEIAADLVARRERWDVSYLVVQSTDTMRAMAPLVARLSGT